MIRHIPHALALCTLVGCGSQLESDYTINLVPHTLQGQAPFVDGRVIELIVIEPDGLSSAIYHAGAIEGGQLTADELPPVAAGSTIGILVENNGGNGVWKVELATRGEDADKPYMAHWIKLARAEPVKLQRK